MFELGNELAKIQNLLKESDQYGSDDDDDIKEVFRCLLLEYLIKKLN
jgi:hypothetical protein